MKPRGKDSGNNKITSMQKQHALTTKSKPYVRFLFISAVFLLTSCAVRLAPKFDQAIVDNLSNATTDVFQLLATVEGGTSKTDFGKREESYNTLIGKLEALELQINARPMPDNSAVNKIVEKANSALKKRNTELPAITAINTAPSATSLASVIKSLAALKKTDKAEGLTQGFLDTQKNFIGLSLDQALTYERFLNK